MSRQTRWRVLPALAVLTVALGGCVSLWPKAVPAHLYALAPEIEPAPAGAAGPAPVNVRLEAVHFEQASGGDRLLTVRGADAAYVADARWVSPAQTLFEDDLTRAFELHGAGVRLLSHGDTAASNLSLIVEVETFQVNLDSGTPTVETALRARIIRYPDRTIVLDRRIDVTRKADADRVSAIVKAYDAAVGAALTTLVDATDQAATGK
jgi:cholesterol transport system auxiliary component